MLLLGVIALACVVLLVVGALGRAAVEAARARTAADAAALAGALGGEREATDVARANGATLLRFERLGTDTEVAVRVGRAVAVARARPGRSP